MDDPQKNAATPHTDCTIASAHHWAPSFLQPLPMAQVPWSQIRFRSASAGRLPSACIGAAGRPSERAQPNERCMRDDPKREDSPLLTPSRPRSPPAGPQGGHLKIDPPAARSPPTSAPGAAAPGCSEATVEAVRRNRRGWGRGRAAAVRTADLRPPHRRACRPLSRITRVPMSTRDPGSPRRPRPGSAASLPPRGSPGAGQAGSRVLRPWARAPPPASPPPRSLPGRQPHWEQTLQVVHPPQLLPLSAGSART
ncbi:uncharacterized protein [Chlorocebus sabaeus]|uniref:uncharacterized protein n=1 Tax=Chlorocebus sabaeus TaxID=60711 RepID=UPI003BF9ED77